MSSHIERLTTALSHGYRIERELGRGGMALVYLAEDLRHARKVALKVLRPDLAAAMGAERFLREIQIAAKLTHPNILPLFDSGRVAVPDTSGTSVDHLYYTMPYLMGESLRDRMRREKQLPVDEAVHGAGDAGPEGGGAGTQRVRRATDRAAARGSRHRESPRTSAGRPVCHSRGVRRGAAQA
jgi:serine/threonine-protein kinase